MKTAREGIASRFEKTGFEKSVTGTAFLGELPQHFLACRNCFPLPLRARLLVVLTLLQLRENPRLLTFPFEAAKRVLE
jgi:hypothetical protein